MKDSVERGDRDEKRVRARAPYTFEAGARHEVREVRPREPTGAGCSAVMSTA